jgi:hypothetical protein
MFGVCAALERLNPALPPEALNAIHLLDATLHEIPTADL